MATGSRAESSASLGTGVSSLRPGESGVPSGERMLREERILDAAAALLVRFGYRKTTIDDVAREAGVGKGTIYLHWKDKNELFRASIKRASEQVTADTLRRLAADPEGGRFHRLWSHGMLALLANPLMLALMRGRSDIFQGFIGSMDAGTVNQLMGNSEVHVTQLQHAGLIRRDLPVPLILYLMGALKVGIIHAADLVGPERMPSLEELAEALSDLIRRWLEPDDLPMGGEVGKQIMADWLQKTNDIE